MLVKFPEEMNGANFRILELAGRVLFEGTSAPDTKILELDLREVLAGIYIFEAYDYKRVLRQRFIKK